MERIRKATEILAEWRAESSQDDLPYIKVLGDNNIVLVNFDTIELAGAEVDFDQIEALLFEIYNLLSE